MWFQSYMSFLEFVLFLLLTAVYKTFVFLWFGIFHQFSCLFQFTCRLIFCMSFLSLTYQNHLELALRTRVTIILLFVVNLSFLLSYVVSQNIWYCFIFGCRFFPLVPLQQTCCRFLSTQAFHCSPTSSIYYMLSYCMYTF